MYIETWVAGSVLNLRVCDFYNIIGKTMVLNKVEEMGKLWQ